MRGSPTVWIIESSFEDACAKDAYYFLIASIGRVLDAGLAVYSGLILTKRLHRGLILNKRLYAG